jgi:hypothetical protein
MAFCASAASLQQVVHRPPTDETLKIRALRDCWKKIRAVRGKPTARVLDPEIADLLPGAGAAYHKFEHKFLE